ncbi:restriction endonuclease subunit S [Ulvibacterium sp.]|uniref:restriction endonuclease subunit S n=1 Tax=Ulvibacterium sp. TaxID=2665914 RepID=UPI002621B06A|nr:restriction endonuclease subunit S [Ulvibacterium sp.]
MISISNLELVLEKLGFTNNDKSLSRTFPISGAKIKVDLKKQKIIYPENEGLIVNERQTCNFSQKENFIVLECVCRLLEKGYSPRHIELEPRWKVGHGASGGRADIMVKDNSEKSLMIIECKTEGKEFQDSWKKTLINGGQLFSYVKQSGSTQYICLYTAKFNDNCIIPSYYLITLKDNERLLEELKDKKPISFKIAKSLDVEDIYNAWKYTYNLDYSTKGVFEEDISPYEIGKTKYSLKDLSIINNQDIQGKYHEFATILRQHNVSGRENAFDKLVNLFLCKIVDETNNPDELKFYWKGIANDNFFDLIDRLQKLYQEGMQRFLGEDVVYISSDQIDKAFDFFKNDPDATRETIKKYFKELKFFNNNDFGFIDVHNEKLFYQNTSVLLKIVQMLQDIKLKTDGEEHQFLGDMFEGFLDQGVKQSEGQFFTPTPIVKFILKSLPLDNIIIDSDEIPKVIDFACGAGHFLNEYAKEIKSVVEERKEAKMSDYHQNIFGIEKEYRLSKVAKVSAFMYGQDSINIVYADALSSGKAMDIKSIKDGTFSVLVANPPYSVKGFLETLTESERGKYRLIETVGEKSYPNNNSIEAFFIERAKQLLKPGGVAGIVVPSSILNKGKAKSTSKTKNIYMATREILLKFFKIVAISEFGSGTFGKTGTNTVTLFIKRKKENPSPADHYKNRVDAWFEHDKSKDGVFEDEHFLKIYCNHLELDFGNYQSLLLGAPNEALLGHEIFIEYRKAFDKWTDIRNLKTKRTFKELSNEDKGTILRKKFVEYLIENEKEKLYYFVLASSNGSKVLITKSPKKSAKMKSFLGYEWSSAKGNEGIKYMGGAEFDSFEIGDQDNGDVLLEEEDKRVLSNIFNLNNINTPLYDPNDNYNPNKVNSLISKNFVGESFNIPEELKEYTSTARLVDMMNFGLVNFNKSISLSPNNTIKLKTKWDTSKLSKIVDVTSGGTPSTTVPTYWGGNIPWLSVADFNNGNRFVSESEKHITEEGLNNSNANYIEPDDIVLSARGTVGAFAQVARRMTFNQSCYGLRAKDGISNSYLYYILGVLLEQLKAKAYGSKFDAITESTFNEIFVPIPPPEIQKKIVALCSKLDEEFEKANSKISKLKAQATVLYEEAYQKANKTYKLSDTDIFDVSIGRRVLKREVNLENRGIEVYSANVFQSFGYIEKDLLKDFSLPSIVWGIDGDWMVNYFPSGKKFYPTDHCGVLRVKVDNILPKYLAWVINKEGERVRFSRSNRASMDSIKTLTVSVPSKEVQSLLIGKIETLESKILKLKSLLSEIPRKKDLLIQSYL